jgi:hypothetical protein
MSNSNQATDVEATALTAADVAGSAAAPVVQASDTDALDPSSTKAGETLLTQALESHREICKTMISVTTASLGAYVGLLGLGDKSKLLFLLQSQTSLAAAPVVLFAAAASLYLCGYFHREGPVAVLDALKSKDRTAITTAIDRTVTRRRIFLWCGNAGYWIAVSLGLYLAWRVHAA